MEKKCMKAGAVIALGIVIMSLVSCATPQPKDRGEDFLGDFNPIQLSNLMGLTYNSVSGIKPVEIRSYLVPRTNPVELYFRDFANEIGLVLDKKTRDQIKRAAEEYLSSYENNKLADQKPAKENAFIKGSMSLGWGILNASRYTVAPYRVNYKFIDNKPYFLLYINPTPDVDDSSAYSPLVELYMSPSQLHIFLDLTEQTKLEAIVAEYNTKAYTFE
jgi:hypothetical protein